MRVLVYVLATALVAVGVLGGSQSEIAQDGDESQSTFSEQTDAAVVTIDSAISDASLSTSSSQNSPSSTNSLPALAIQPSIASGQFKCMYQDGTSDIYSEQVDGRATLFRCLKGTKCFQLPNAPSRIKCNYADSATAVEGTQRLASQHWQAKTVITALDSGRHYFAQVPADIDASADAVSMSTVNLDLPIMGLPTSSEPKVISLNVVLPTIAIRVTEDPDAPNVATVISIDPFAEFTASTSTTSTTSTSSSTSSTSSISSASLTSSTSSSSADSGPVKTLTRIVEEFSSPSPIPIPRVLTVTATVTASAESAPSTSSTSILSITASSDMVQFTQSMISRFATEDSQMIDKQRHAITVNGVELPTVARSLKPTTTTVIIVVSASALSPAGTLSVAQPTPQRVTAMPSSVQREYIMPPAPPPPMMAAEPSRMSPMVFHGSDYRDPPAASELMSAPIINRPLRQSWPNRAPAPGPAPMPSPMPSLSSPAPIVYPQSVPSIWYPAPRMSASATPQFAPQPPQPMPQAQQTEQSGPLITVVMRPNYGIYSIPISSYPFGMVPLQMAQAPPPNTIVSTPSVVSSIEILPTSSSASADSSDSHNTPIIPFVSNGARQPTPTNTVQSPSKEKSNHINAHGIVSILQEVFHIPPSAISIDGKPIDIADMGAKEGRGSIGVSKNNKHGDDDNDNDDDSDNDAQDSGDREQDLELDSRYNLGEIARNRRKVRSKVKAVGRVVKTLTKKESRSANDNSKSSSVSDEGSNGDSVRTDQSATATSTSPAESADKASNISTSMNLASHDGALLSIAMSDTTLSAAIKVERADDDDDSAPASQTDDD